MKYERIVEKEAREFIENHEDIIKTAIVDDEDNFMEIDGIETGIHENAEDRAYTLSDAAFVIDNSDNVENDSGIWEGYEPYAAIKTQATYTFRNDVRIKCEEMYKEMKTAYEDEYYELYTPCEDSIEPDGEKIINEIFADFVNEYTIVPIETGTTEELHLLKKWVERNHNAGMRGGHPLGSSYINSRCSVGYGQMNQYDYIEFDSMVAKMLPDMVHKHKETVGARIKELENKFSTNAETNIRIDDTLADGEIVCNERTKETIWTQQKGETR